MRKVLISILLSLSVATVYASQSQEEINNALDFTLTRLGEQLPYYAIRIAERQWLVGTNPVVADNRNTITIIRTGAMRESMQEAMILRAMLLTYLEDNDWRLRDSRNNIYRKRINGSWIYARIPASFRQNNGTYASTIIFSSFITTFAL